MKSRARSTEFAEIEGFRAHHRSEAGCQIVRDSILPRRLAEPFAIELDGRLVGYAGVWTEHFPGRIMEFYLVPEARSHSEACFSAVLAASGAQEIEAQTNLPQLTAMLERFAMDIGDEKIVFEDAGETSLTMPGVTFRARRDGDEGPGGDWVLDRNGLVVAAGGFLTHYNPPYCDVFMEVAEGERRRGLGGYLVQELRRASQARGLIPAARCSVENEASRRTLERGGFRECGRIAAGRVRRAAPL